jgi:hypothetical protein
LDKCYKKNPRAGFSVVSLFFACTKREVNGEKNRHAGFSYSIFPDGVRFCVGDQPEQSTTTQEKCDSRRFAEIRGKITSCIPPNQLLPDLHTTPNLIFLHRKNPSSLTDHPLLPIKGGHYRTARSGVYMS